MQRALDALVIMLIAAATLGVVVYGVLQGGWR